ncbi:ATP-binding protein [Nonomuraea monospora]
MRCVGERRFPGRPENVRDVRSFAAHLLAKELPGAAADGALLYDVRLLVSELSANAIEHTFSGRRRRGSFHVRVWLGEDRIRCEVRDQGWWSGPQLRHEPRQASGRGLQLVAAMARWGVRRHWFGRIVWFEMPLAKGCLA